MYIIIAGCRKVGSNLAIVLSQGNHDVVVIDSDPANFELLGSGFNGLTITGMPIDEDVLRSAGIEKADALAAVSNDDNINVMISTVASKIFHVPRVITRVYDPEREVVFNKMGMTTICPTILAVEKIKDYLVSPEPHENHIIHGTSIAFNYQPITHEFVGKKLNSIGTQNVFGLIRHDRLILIDTSLLIEENDIAVLVEYAD